MAKVKVVAETELESGIKAKAKDLLQMVADVLDSICNNDVLVILGLICTMLSGASSLVLTPVTISSIVNDGFSDGSAIVGWIFLHTIAIWVIVLAVVEVIGWLLGKFEYLDFYAKDIFYLSMIVFTVLGVVFTITASCSYEQKVSLSEEIKVEDITIYDDKFIKLDELYIPYDNTEVIYVSTSDTPILRARERVKCILGDEIARREDYVLYLPTPAEKAQNPNLS